MKKQCWTTWFSVLNENGMLGHIEMSSCWKKKKNEGHRLISLGRKLKCNFAHYLPLASMQHCQAIIVLLNHSLS